jgi:hypothetical protein
LPLFFTITLFYLLPLSPPLPFIELYSSYPRLANSIATSYASLDQSHFGIDSVYIFTTIKCVFSFYCCSLWSSSFLFFLFLLNGILFTLDQQAPWKASYTTQWMVGTNCKQNWSDQLFYNGGCEQQWQAKLERTTTVFSGWCAG